MNEVLILALSWLAGGGLGAFFFGGVWWTVRTDVPARLLEPWLLCSVLLRVANTLVGFHLVSGNDWRRLLLCLLGFVMARLVVEWTSRLAGGDHGRHEQEATDAP